MGETNRVAVRCVLRALPAKAQRQHGCCLGSVLELRASEREGESESERVGEWMAVSPPFRLGSAGRRRRTAATRRAQPAPGRPPQRAARPISGLKTASKT